MSRAELWDGDTLTAQADGLFVQPRPERAARDLRPRRRATSPRPLEPASTGDVRARSRRFARVACRLQSAGGRADAEPVNRCPGCGYIVPGAWTECRALRRARAPARSRPRPSLAERAQRARARAAATAGSAPGTRARRRARGRDATGFGAPDDALLPGAAPRDIGPDTMLPRPLEPAIRITVAPPRAARVGERARRS